MGFWSGLGKGLLGAIPVVGPIVGGIIQGAEESKAAKTAANQQIAATDQAIALRKPYADTGLQAFQTLSGLMGLGGPGGQVATPSLSGSSGPQGVVTRNSSANYPLPMGAISDPSKNGGYAGQVPGTATLGSASSYANPQRPGYGPQSSPIPTVKMQAPDGSTQDVPGDQVSHYTQLGAKVVG